MPILGAHMSIAGGYFKALEAGRAATCDCVQVFTKNNNQWRAKPITPEEAEKFSATLASENIVAVLSHASYLINLATPKEDLWNKSIDALVLELRRANQLGIPSVVVHPGAFTTSSEAAGIQRISAALDEVCRQTSDGQAICLLENTAGQGTNLGWKFEQLALMIDGVKSPDSIGICIDTCHAFAAGYELSDQKAFQAALKELDQTVGLTKVKAMHLNDSKRPLGSRVDRHEHIGQGHLGMEAFANVVNEPRLVDLPMYLETPKGTDETTGEDWDMQNLSRLRQLVE